jgi:hypothetical protein
MKSLEACHHNLAASAVPGRDVKQDRYLTEHRLQDVLAALQFLATYDDYDLTDDDFRKRIGAAPKSAKCWSEVFADHPEFFRQSEFEGDYSLILRRAKVKDAKGIRPPLSSTELFILFETATHLQKHELELLLLKIAHQRVVERGPIRSDRWLGCSAPASGFGSGRTIL